MVPSSSNVSSNVFQINDKVKPKIKLTRGKAYRFDQSHVSNGSMGYSGSSHPMRISTSSDGVHKGGTAYNSGVVYSKNTGHIRSYIVFEVPSNAPSKLYYYCHNHPNMGGVIDIIGGNINDFGNNTIEVISTRGAASSNEVRVIAR